MAKKTRLHLAQAAVVSALACPVLAEAQTVPQTTTTSAPSSVAGDTGNAKTAKLLGTSKSKASNAETVTVVGSALSQAANQNANPVQIITAKQIQQTSAVTIGDYLQRLPSVGSQAQQNTVPNGGDGIACTDIRNLGINRVLVLIDGKRQVQTFGNGGSCVNLNAIPIDQVASIEILKDGGSELYGADAVSGVINIKLKHDINGAGIDLRGGTTDVWDGKTGKLSAYKGMDFAQGRGNITLFGQYQVTDGIMQKDRPWAARPWLSNTLIGQQPSFGSGLTGNTRVIDPNGNFDLVSNGTGGGPNGFHDKGPSDNFPYYNYQSLTNELQESNLSADGHFDVNDHAQIYGDVRYTHQTAANQLAPLGVEGSSTPSTLPSAYVLPAGNPYNIWGEDVDLYKRAVEVGPREYKESFDTTQILGGVRGRIVGHWNYDASYTYGLSRGEFTTDNMVDYGNALRQLGVQQVDPTNPGSAVVYNPAVCQQSVGCNLTNPFAPLNLQDAAYQRYNQVDHDSYQMRDFNLRVDNSEVAHLPWAHGGAFGLAMGLEHRSEQANYSPDPVAEVGELGGGASYTGGGYDTTEAYIEGRLQLLHDVPFARDLTVDGQGRWSNYNTFGNAYNWKGSINWAVTRDIRFRGTLGTSFRAPAISELYAGRGIGYYGGTDPCEAVSSYGQYAGNVQARCAAQGINTATFTNANTGTIPQLVGGNPSLQPEIGRTYTIGTVLTPRWTPGLELDIEYWHYKISNLIGTLPGQYILDQCYTGQNLAYCSDIAARSTSGQLTQVNTTNMNLGGLRTSGLDIDLHYRVRLGAHDTLLLDNNLQQLIGYTEQNYPGGPWVNYIGRAIYQSGYGNPRLRDYASATWTHRNFALTYMLNYTAGMTLNDGTNDLSCKQYSFCSVPGIFSHDVTAAYRFGRWNLQAGVNNLLDKRPPFVPGTGINTENSLYASEMIGRFVFMDLTARF
ncbi:TonB-dependent receptor [Acetobacteraceae bacterium KSS8]|uniref:TonB-dependent receptor n=1 Tax=Endosaccharibacter trunci TaxID=2812733 RepID=A0ABT1W6Q9_9PROT|nr:TonB-dependent receptor [Acetobacteraceae bacterium KSS8]